MRVLVLLILGLALASCGTLYDAPPQKPMKLASETSPQEWCRDALLLVDNPFYEPDTKDAVEEEMRRRHCPAPM